MQKTMLITGSTDGIGLEAAKMLLEAGHRVLLHGRNPDKLARTQRALASLAEGGHVEGYVADLARMQDVEALADKVIKAHDGLDVLINNAGIFATPAPITKSGLDVRFVVNTLAPYLLTRRLLPLIGRSGRVVNLSSAAQSPVDLEALAGEKRLSDFAAYAQSKLALTIWSRSLALELGGEGPTIIAVNPGSMLGTKMVKEAFGSAGGDVRVGAEILRRLAVADEFAAASGQYFDNDAGRMAPPHADALDADKAGQVVEAIERLLSVLAR